MSHLLIGVESWPINHEKYRQYLLRKVYKHHKYGLWNLIVREIKLYDIHIPADLVDEVANDLAIDSDEEIGFFNKMMRYPILGRLLKKFIPKLEPVEIDYKKLEERRKKGERGFCDGILWARIRGLAKYNDDWHKNEKGEVEEGL